MCTIIFIIILDIVYFKTYVNIAFNILLINMIKYYCFALINQWSYNACIQIGNNRPITS